MTQKNGDHLRKQPTQERAQATVERIVSASGRVLACHGYSGCSTNRIADEAGVSKGSIYQYFADKDEILTQLAQTTMNKVMSDVGAAIDVHLGGDLMKLGRCVLEASFDTIELHQPVLQPLLLEAPHIDVIGMTASIRQRAQDIARAYIAMKPGEFRTDLDSEAMIFVLFTTLTATMVSYLTGTTDLSRERITATLTQLAAECLTSPGPAPAG